jgi:hypothetical protein
MTNISTPRAMALLAPIVIAGALLSSTAHNASAASAMSQSKAYAASEAARHTMLRDQSFGFAAPTYSTFDQQRTDVDGSGGFGVCLGTHLDHISGRC